MKPGMGNCPNSYRHASLCCTLLYCISQVLLFFSLFFFLTKLKVCVSQPCFQQVFRLHLSNTVCSFYVCVSHFDTSCNVHTLGSKNDGLSEGSDNGQHLFSFSKEVFLFKISILSLGIMLLPTYQPVVQCKHKFYESTGKPKNSYDSVVIWAFLWGLRPKPAVFSDTACASGL